MNNLEKIIDEINALESIFLECKSVFPAMSTDLIGKKSFASPEFYRKRGFNVSIRTSNPITQEFIDRNSRIVKWINENAIIRLYGIIYHHNLMENIDKEISGWKEVDLLRRMRNAFTKTPLNHKPTGTKNIKLREKLIEHFNLNNEMTSGDEIPTPVDKVIRPIFEGCRKYIRGKS